MKTTVFSTKSCPFCIQAKKLLSLKGIKFDEVGVIKEGTPKSNEILKKDLQDKIESISGKRIETVPQIFLENNYIGGFTELVNHFENERNDFYERNLQEIKVELKA